MMMIRAWLRSMIGWEDVGSALLAHRDSIATLQARTEDLSKELEALKYMRRQREARNQVRQMTDWESVQMDYALNPKNYEEN